MDAYPFHQRLTYAIHNFESMARECIVFDLTDTIRDVRDRIVALHGSVEKFLFYTMVAEYGKYQRDDVRF